MVNGTSATGENKGDSTDRTWQPTGHVENQAKPPPPSCSNRCQPDANLISRFKFLKNKITEVLEGIQNSNSSKTYILRGEKECSKDGRKAGSILSTSLTLPNPSCRDHPTPEFNRVEKQDENGRTENDLAIDFSWPRVSPESGAGHPLCSRSVRMCDPRYQLQIPGLEYSLSKPGPSTNNKRTITSNREARNGWNQRKLTQGSPSWLLKPACNTDLTMNLSLEGRPFSTSPIPPLRTVF